MTRKRSWMAAGAVAALLISATTLTACGSNPDKPEASSSGGFLGIGGKKNDAASAEQIGVNSFLWRASLDTLSFMPLVSADAFGGTIITDWYANPEAPRERFKATVYILDTRLRADGLNVSVNRQTLTANGWLDAPSDPDVAIQLENKILVRARELRLSTLPN